MVSRNMAYNYSLLGQNLSEKKITVFPDSREADIDPPFMTKASVNATVFKTFFLQEQ